jgi:hypothetical protein
MLRYLLLLIALLPVLAPALAQSGDGPRQTLYRRLGLTKAQTLKAEALQKKYIDLAYGKLAALRKKYGDDPTPPQQKQITREMEVLRQQIQKRASTELRALLTPAQRQKLDELEKPPTIRMRPQ